MPRDDPLGCVQLTGFGQPEYATKLQADEEEQTLHGQYLWDIPAYFLTNILQTCHVLSIGVAWHPDISHMVSLPGFPPQAGLKLRLPAKFYK